MVSLRSARFASVSSLRKTAYRKVGKQGFYIDRDLSTTKDFTGRLFFKKMPSCARAFFFKYLINIRYPRRSKLPTPCTQRLSARYLIAGWSYHPFST